MLGSFKKCKVKPRLSAALAQNISTLLPAGLFSSGRSDCAPDLSRVSSEFHFLSLHFDSAVTYLGTCDSPFPNFKTLTQMSKTERPFPSS